MEKGKNVNNVSDFLVGMIRRETEYKQMLESLYRFSAGGKAYTQGPALVTGVSDGARKAIISSLVLEKKLSEGKTAVVLVPDEKTAYSLKNKLSAFIDGHIAVGAVVDDHQQVKEGADGVQVQDRRLDK